MLRCTRISDYASYQRPRCYSKISAKLMRGYRDGPDKTDHALATGPRRDPDQQVRQDSVGKPRLIQPGPAALPAIPSATCETLVKPSFSNAFKV